MNDPRLKLRFVRHGATSANSAGLRCGGDLDLPMTDLGRAQAERAAEEVARLDPPIDLIITSDLRRARETADVIAGRLSSAEILVAPDFAERRLGEWNLLPIDASQPWLDAGLTPPGGESGDEFAHRIAGALDAIADELPRRPLLVASKGVARVLGEMTGMPKRVELENGALVDFDLSALTAPARPRRLL